MAITANFNRYMKFDCFGVRIQISGVTKCVTKFLTLSQCHFDSVKKIVTHFVASEILTLSSTGLKKMLIVVTSVIIHTCSLLTPPPVFPSLVLGR